MSSKENNINSYEIPMGPPNLFRFRAPNQFTLDELENNYIFFQTRTKLNDELDSNPELVKLNDSLYQTKQLREALINGTSDIITKEYIERMSDAVLNNFVKEKVKPYIENTGIGCFTMYPMNDQLWKEYAKQNKGLCLHFDMDEDKTFFNDWRPITYVKKLDKQVFNSISDQDHITELFFKKTKDWDHEKEIRLLRDKVGAFEFKTSALKNIIIGHSADAQFIKKVINIVERKYSDTKVYQKKKQNSELKFSYKLLYE